MKNKAFAAGMIGVFLLIRPISAQTWTGTKRLTWNSGTSSETAVATDSANNIHVVWHDNTAGNYEIHYKRSTDGGVSWTTKRLTWNSGRSRLASIAVDSKDHIHVVWEDDTPGNSEIYHKKSTDWGSTWTTKRLTWTSGYSRSPTVAADSNNYIYVVWPDNTTGASRLYFKKSTNGGLSWTTKRLTWNPGSSYESSIIADSAGNLHVVCEHYNLAPPEIYYKKSTDGGETWTTKRLTWTLGGSHYPLIAADSSNHLHAVWMDYPAGNNEIFLGRSTDGGTTWTIKRLTWNSGWSSYPCVTADMNDHIHVFWQDDTTGNFQIYHKWRVTWGAPWATERLTWNSESSGPPAVAVDSGNDIHLVWDETTPGSLEIFYKKGIQ